MTNPCTEFLRLLSAHADGALDAGERKRLEEHLADCVRCPDRLLVLRAQGQALRDAVAGDAAQVSFDGFADKVLARARVEKSRALSQASVWTQEMVGAHRSMFAGAGVVLAACMTLAVVFMPSQPPPDDLGLDTQSQVEEVDFGTHDGAVLQLPNETTVIWMSDDRGAAK
jgi:anti-sigma factor RsiW